MGSLPPKDEHIYRVIHPGNDFTKDNGGVSSAAFKDPRGLSVELQCGRTDRTVVSHIRKTKPQLKGKVAKIPVKVCDKFDIVIFNDKSRDVYHRLLLSANKPFDPEGNNSLSRSQARALADNITALLV